MTRLKERIRLAAYVTGIIVMLVVITWPAWH